MDFIAFVDNQSTTEMANYYGKFCLVRIGSRDMIAQKCIMCDTKLINYGGMPTGWKSYILTFSTEEFKCWSRFSTLVLI